MVESGSLLGAPLLVIWEGRHESVSRAVEAEKKEFDASKVPQIKLLLHMAEKRK